MKLAIIHDFLSQMGGAERVVEEFHSIYPEAPIYTSVYNKEALPSSFQKMEIHTSYMQFLPFVSRFFKLYLPFYPSAIRSFKLNDFDVILSSSSAYAKGIRKPKGAKHFCYCHTPAKFLWMQELYFQREKLAPLAQMFLFPLLARQKQWDYKNSQQVDYFIANSRNVAGRIKRFYSKDSVVINPPVDASLIVPKDEEGGFFLVVSRLTTYKRVDLAVKAFNRLGLPLKIIGDGPDRKYLESIAKNNIEFLGFRSDQQVAGYYAACKALIFPGEEDFGIVPVEAMAAGRPVIAYGVGGATETVVPFKTGILFTNQTEESLIEAIGVFNKISFDKMTIRRHAEGFDRTVFKEKVRSYINEKTR
ncbi:MAG: glycosyltransferase [Candidatus Saganbacteria bacterium]|nr:glycosyltransferase [Candidatus Saganbacteria bacterium]